MLKFGKFSVAAAALMAAAISFVTPVQAQDWPTKPVRIIIPYGPGGGTDIMSRLLAQELSEMLGQPFVAENKPGAGSTLGADLVAKAPKDGYTIVALSNAHSVSGALYKTLPYDPVKDFAMVSQIGTTSLVLVTSSDFKAKNLKDLMAAAKAEPGKVNFASVGAGTTQHFAGELFRVVSKLDIKHIPYKTTPNVIAAMRSNEVQMTFELVPAVQGQIASKDLTAIAVTSSTRYPGLPDVPTMKEAGLSGYDVASWYGFAFPAGTPKPVVDKLNKAMVAILAKPKVKEELLKRGIEVKSSTPEQLTKHVSDEIKKWSDLMKTAGIAQQ